MPLIYNQVVYDDCKLAIWEITETYEDLYSQIHFFEGEKEKLYDFKSNFRQLEWLSVRRLLREVRGVPTRIVYNEQRKPFIYNAEQHISISHSHYLTSVLLSDTRKLGLDLEFMGQNIEKVAHKFLNEDEYICEEAAKRNFHMYIHWCAKEALYKLCDKQDINFRKNITIEPFEPDVCGEIMGWVDNKFWHDKFLIRYFTIKGYIIVYCCK